MIDFYTEGLWYKMTVFSKNVQSPGHVHKRTELLKISMIFSSYDDDIRRFCFIYGDCVCIQNTIAELGCI